MAKLLKMNHQRVVLDLSMDEWRALIALGPRLPGFMVELLPGKKTARPQVVECPMCRRDTRLIDGRLMPHPKVGPLCAGSRREVNGHGGLVPEPPLVRLK